MKIAKAVLVCPKIIVFDLQNEFAKRFLFKIAKKTVPKFI